MRLEKFKTQKKIWKVLYDNAKIKEKLVDRGWE